MTHTMDQMLPQFSMIPITWLTVAVLEDQDQILLQVLPNYHTNPLDHRVASLLNHTWLHQFYLQYLELKAEATVGTFTLTGNYDLMASAQIRNFDLQFMAFALIHSFDQPFVDTFGMVNEATTLVITGFITEHDAFIGLQVEEFGLGEAEVQDEIFQVLLIREVLQALQNLASFKA